MFIDAYFITGCIKRLLQYSSFPVLFSSGKQISGTRHVQGHECAGKPGWLWRQTLSSGGRFAGSGASCLWPLQFCLCPLTLQASVCLKTAYTLCPQTSNSFFFFKSQLITAIAWRGGNHQRRVSFPPYRPEGYRGWKDPFRLIQKCEDFTFSFSIKWLRHCHSNTCCPILD